MAMNFDLIDILMNSLREKIRSITWRESLGSYLMQKKGCSSCCPDETISGTYQEIQHQHATTWPHHALTGDYTKHVD